MGAEAKLVEVVDNNSIDREVHRYKPTHVFIEALWVVPPKFEVLIPLHPTVEWHVRLHSNTPFLANEGMAMDWIKKYDVLQKKYPQFHISPNAQKMCEDLRLSLDIPTIYSPNVYQPHKSEKEFEHETPKDKDPKVLEIGCFGAIRPMKNQLIQAMAAMTFAEELKKTLHFHVNHSRLEQNGDNAFKNIQALFQGTKHKLVTHEWVLHHEFLKIIRGMDIGLQVSFSETFNIVAADFVHMRVPIVGSDEIPWLSSLYRTNPTELPRIVDNLWLAWIGKKINLHYLNNWGLDNWNHNARIVWKNYLRL